ncbi:MAG: hypothetical protein CMJ38_00450 [Phycisphaerae bacterium]|nr:hypothetical protein [Phycisphaerae bacterium]
MSTKYYRKSKQNKTKKSNRPNKLIVTKIANHSLNRNDVKMEDLINISNGINKEIIKLKEDLIKKINEKKEIEKHVKEIKKLDKTLEYIKSIKVKEIDNKKDESINELLKKLMDFFIDNYLELSREYKRKHNMKKKYIYEEAMFFEIVIFLILSKYMIGYDNAIKRLLSSGNDLYRLRKEILVYESLSSLEKYKDKLKEINEKRLKLNEKIRDIREGDRGIMTLTLQAILDKIQSNQELDQYFSKLYGNYLSRGENSKSLLLHHIHRNFEEEINNNSNYSLDKSTRDIYEHVLNLGPKMNELILRSIKNRNSSDNTLTNADISKYNSFEDFIIKKKFEKKRNKKKYKDQEEKLAKIYDFLDPKNDFENNKNSVKYNTKYGNNRSKNKTKKSSYRKSNNSYSKNTNNEDNL